MNERSGLRLLEVQGPQLSYRAIESDSDDEEGTGWTKSFLSCAAAIVPHPDAAWPASFNTSAALLLRQAPTTEALEERKDNW
jgi:hypothetical protein